MLTCLSCPLPFTDRDAHGLRRFGTASPSTGMTSSTNNGVDSKHRGDPKDVLILDILHRFSASRARRPKIRLISSIAFGSAIALLAPCAGVETDPISNRSASHRFDTDEHFFITAESMHFSEDIFFLGRASRSTPAASAVQRNFSSHKTKALSNDSAAPFPAKIR